MTTPAHLHPDNCYVCGHGPHEDTTHKGGHKFWTNHEAAMEFHRNAFPEPEYPQTSGSCEDFPCCGHEAGDCFGQLYGSDEDIKQSVYDRMYDDGYDPYYDEQDY